MCDPVQGVLLLSVPLLYFAVWHNLSTTETYLRGFGFEVGVIQQAYSLYPSSSCCNDSIISRCHYRVKHKTTRYVKTYHGLRGLVNDSNYALVRNLTPMQAYKALGIVRDANDTVKDFEPLPPPVGTYYTIVIDPPWPINWIEGDRIAERPNQVALEYPTMSFDDLEEMRDDVLAIAAPDCHLYLWTTHKFLERALSIVSAWGFSYQCQMTWVKNVGFTPYSWMYSTEHILFCRRGNLPLLKKGVRLDFEAKVREHSRKPDEFYEIIKAVSPSPRLDWFSRGSHDGFDSWGNEKGKFDEMGL